MDALSASERSGLRIFIDVGCVNCHNGANVGGNEFEKFGIFVDYWKETHSQPIDEGRFDLTHKADDRYVFKVPGLRNVTMTPPYFHDGSIDTLPEAVRIMAKVQLDKTLSEADANAIIEFLKCLTGPLPDSYAKSPELPAAGFVPTPSSPRTKQQ
jgi:cytochrome c peroxidase